MQEVFPGRSSHAVSAFTLAEIRQLTVRPVGPQASFAYPGFTPSRPDPVKVPAFEEVPSFRNARNAANGTNVGIYPEAKNPTGALMHRQIAD